MGVGTYRSDFGGAGISIPVRGASVSQDDYVRYIKDTPEGGFVPSYEEYLEEADRQVGSEIKETLSRVGKAVGLHPVKSGSLSVPVDFDSEITTAATGDVVELGWRGWQHDYVVAIGPNSYLKDGILPGREIDPVWAVEERVRSPQGFGKDYFAIVDGLEELVRLSLARAGLTTSIPTSGYTSVDWAVHDGDPAPRIAELTQSVSALVAKLSAPSGSSAVAIPREESLEMAKVVLDAGNDGGSLPRVVFPLFDVDANCVTLWESSEDGGGPSISTRVPADMMEKFRSLPSEDGLAVIPFDEGTRDWFEGIQARLRQNPFPPLVVSAAEWSDLAGKPCVVSWDDDSGTTFTLELETGKAVAVAAPGP